jgi:hypothetical protein
MLEALITYCGQTARVCCDGNCWKAWGLGIRPHEQLSENVDDVVYFADDELGIAPDDPGTYEGGHAKPRSAAEFPNKWCVRACERCAMSKPGEWRRRIAPKDWTQRVYNIPRSAAAEKGA